jgi:hypothetical protein
MSITNSNYQHHPFVTRNNHNQASMSTSSLHHNQMLHINTNFDALSYNTSLSPDLPSPPPLPRQPTFHHQQQQQQQQMNRNSMYSNNFYDNIPPAPPAMLDSPRLMHQEPLLSPTASISSTNTLLSPATAVVKTADIQTESPKNMTVVQQGKIMPYKEVSKPFEMSDFYKYSTKFRQKQQLQSGSESPVYSPPNINSQIENF